MSVNISENELKKQIEYMKPILNERQYRLFLGTVAISIGRGGQSLVARLSGASVNTVHRGIEEVKSHKEKENPDRVRKPGGGRKSSSEKYPNIQKAIEEIIDGKIYGDPEKIIHWTTMGLMDIAEKLKADYGIEVCHTVVSKELTKMGYSKQLNQKMLQVGTPHPDRNAQFEYINATAQQCISQGVPVISIDCKKKENIGNFKNGGAEYRRKGDARKVWDHDFPIKELGAVAPYGIYDVDKNTGFVNLGTSHDTAAFAVESIRAWWLRIGKATFPNATKLYVPADGGGSNGSRSRLWKLELAKLAQEIRIPIEVFDISITGLSPSLVILPRMFH